MKLLPSVHEKNIFTDDELNLLVELINQNTSEKVMISSDGRYEGLETDRHRHFDYYSDNNKKIRSILEPRLLSALKVDFQVVLSFMLHSIKPILVHTDYVQIPEGEPVPTYSVIIPLGNYDSRTVIFNEAQEGDNDLDLYRETNPRATHSREELEFFKKYLNHISLNDIKYLTLKEYFEWEKGALFAFDRRHFHCSDNYIKNGEESKKSIIIFLGKKD